MQYSYAYLAMTCHLDMQGRQCLPVSKYIRNRNYIFLPWSNINPNPGISRHLRKELNCQNKKMQVSESHLYVCALLIQISRSMKNHKRLCKKLQSVDLYPI